MVLWAVQQRQAFVWLHQHVPAIRFALAKRLKHMKRVPELVFRLSDEMLLPDNHEEIEDQIVADIEEHQRLQAHLHKSSAPEFDLEDDGRDFTFANEFQGLDGAKRERDEASVENVKKTRSRKEC